jgi:hypothetical protein
VTEAPPELVDELYGAPPDEFIARRDARAKELRKRDRAAAHAIKKLRRPSVSAAAVNQLVRRAPDDVEALLAAGEALRQAQLGGGDRDAIRAAARDEREAVEKLVERAGKLSPAALEEVRETLHAAATDEEVRELVRRGVLTEARHAMGLGGFGAVAPAPAPAKKPAKKQAATKRPSGDAERERKAEAERARKAKAERKRAARERVKEARAALRDAEKSLRQAEREADSARADVERRRDELEQAEADAG